MIEVSLFGLDLILLMAIWHFMLRKTILDTSRDFLFDAREEVRDFFKDRKNGLSDKTYLALRDHINNYIRYTEEATLTHLFIATKNLENHKELCLEKQKAFEALLQSDDPEVARFVEKMRAKAYHHLLGYCLHSNLVTVIFTYVMLVVVAIYFVITQIRTVFRNSVSKSWMRFWITFTAKMEGLFEKNVVEIIPDARGCFQN